MRFRRRAEVVFEGNRVRKLFWFENEFFRICRTVEMNGLKLSANRAILGIVGNKVLEVGGEAEFIPFEEVLGFVLEADLFALVLEDFGLELLYFLLNEVPLLFELEIGVDYGSVLCVKTAQSFENMFQLFHLQIRLLKFVAQLVQMGSDSIFSCQNCLFICRLVFFLLLLSL